MLDVLARWRGSLSETYLAATDERHAHFCYQRSVIDLAKREMIADQIAEDLPKSPQLFCCAEDRNRLSERGIVFVDGLANPEQVADIRAYFAELPAYDPYRRLGNFIAPDRAPAATHIAHYRQEDIAKAPHLLEIANDSRVLSLAEGFLGAKPTLAAMRAWWSTPSPENQPEHAELFHRDMDDFRAIKLFVYLTDVDEYAGPHVYAVGSHRKDMLTKAAARYSDEEAIRAAGSETILTVTGKAGTSFLAAAYGLHRGTRPIARPRLVFQPLYTLRPTIYGPKAPLRPCEPALDPYVNRLFFHS
jgi:hypothetical protein